MGESCRLANGSTRSMFGNRPHALATSADLTTLTADRVDIPLPVVVARELLALIEVIIRRNASALRVFEDGHITELLGLLEW